MGYRSKIAFLFLLLIFVSGEVYGQQLYVEVPVAVGGGISIDSLRAQLYKRGVAYGSVTLHSAIFNTFYNYRAAVDSLMEYGYKLDLYVGTDTLRISGNDSPDVMLPSIYNMARRVAMYTGIPCDSSRQILFPLGVAPKDSVQVWCSDGSTWSYVRTIHFMDPTANIVDTIYTVTQ